MCVGGPGAEEKDSLKWEWFSKTGDPDLGEVCGRVGESLPRWDQRSGTGQCWGIL